MSASEAVPGRSRFARWSLAFRLARREFRRHPWRHTLVVVMIAVPVLSAMVAFSAVSTIQRVEETESTYRAYGSDLRVEPWVDLDDAQIDRLRGMVPPGSRVEIARQSADWLATDRQRADGRGPVLIGARTTETPDGSTFGERFRIEVGHQPADPDEIFLTRSLADVGGWGVGDRIESGRDVRTFTVAGIGVARDDTAAELAVLNAVPSTYWTTDLPGFDHVTFGDLTVRSVLDEGYLDGTDLQPSRDVFVWLPEGADVAAVHQALASVEISTQQVGSSPFERLLGPGMALVFGALSAIVAIVASAAFAIASRRQLRSVGLLASAGADPRTIRAALVLQGAFPGLVAAALALIVGLTGAGIADSQGLLASLVHVDGARTVVSVGGVALALVLGVLAGTMAAWMPARSASRVPVLSALAGRRPVGPVATKVPLTGLVFVALGGGGLALLVRRTASHGGTDLVTTATPLLMIATVLSMLFGLIALAPTLVAGVGSLSHRVTGTTRIALRGIARHRSQSAAAVAAVAICLAVPVGVLTTKASLDAEEARERESWPVPESRAGDESDPGDDGSFLPQAPPPSVRTSDDAMTVLVRGDLTAPEVDGLVAQVEAITGPVTRMPFVVFTDGDGGWYTVAAIDPPAAAVILAPWAAEQIQAGRAVALSGTPGPVTLDDDVNHTTIEAVGDPGGGSSSITRELSADYLVPAQILDVVGVGRPPINLALLGPDPLRPEQTDAIDHLWMGPRSMDAGVALQHPTLAQLRDARQRAAIEPAGAGTGAPDPGFDEPDVWLSVEYPPSYSESAMALDRPPDRGSDPTFQRLLRVVALVAGGLSLLVLTITLSLRAVDSVDDHRAAIAAGAAPARIRRQHALEGMVLATLGALLAIPLGWLPVTAVRFGQVRRQYGPDAGSSMEAVTTRLHLPGWEVVPILVLPIVAVGVLWLVAPLLRSLVQRGPVDQVLPRY